jgi:ABC-type branched-subunit amino acid transport system permease subunit
MESRRSSNVFAALVATGLLLLAAWGNALALLLASAVGLAIGWVFFRWDGRRAALAMLTGAVVAAVLVVVAKQLH